MQQHAFANEHEEQAQAPSKQNENQKRRWETRLQYFVNWEPEKQLQAFFTWLPKELHDAPGIDWPALPREIMGYSLRAIGNSPDVVTLALAAGVLTGAVSVVSHLTMLKHLNLFFRDLRITCHIQSPADLKDAQIWHEWASHQEGKEARRQWVDSYASFTTGHFPLYLLRLDQAGRLRMQQYALPSLPPGLREKYFPMKQIRKVQQAKRKEQTDILVPLYPVLRQLIRFRKQLAERTVLAIREACRKVEEGSVHLPFRFELTSTIPEVNRNAQTIAEIQIYGREVCLPFILWDKRAWVEHHPDLYSNEIVRVADESQKYYDQEHNCFFVQFDGPASDCLWFGDLVEHRLFQRFEKAGVHLEGYQERWQLARQLGFSAGCHCGRPGLLASRDRWFSIAADRSKALIFEPESLYRGVLFGSALAMIALSNGSRVNELLQVSWNKERRITRQESVVLLGEDGQPLLGDDDQPLTKQVKLYFQHLLPKGAKTDEERQLFPLTRECMRLLGEIKALLEETHREIPIVAPSRSHTKYEHLQSERYLFQWDTSPDGTIGALGPHDVGVLLRFMLHGLDLFTAQGKPIRVSTHILRHVMSTHARHYRNVPPEAIAYFFLHHRLRELTGRDPSLPEITEYYTLMTEEQRFAIISADLDEQEEMDHALLQAAPTPRDLEQMNEDLRVIFELWHALHPTALGYCGCPGLCPRGNDRALCLGCSYLITDPERIGAARSWRESYAKQAKTLEAQGNFIDARQARIKVQLLDDIINVMCLQLQAEADGSYIPLHKVLPSPHRKTEEGDDEEN